MPYPSPGMPSVVQHVRAAPVPPPSGQRDPIKQPFDRRSPWIMPIGTLARFVYANIRHATAQAFFVDSDVLCLTRDAIPTDCLLNGDDWGGGTRCSPQGGRLFNAPMPGNWVVPGSHQGSSDGDTPNAATAILAADGHSLIQTQPFSRCFAGQAATSHYMFGAEDLFGLGITGSHGGSGLSALGGTVRLGELVRGGRIPHALKFNIDSVNFYAGFQGFRWPAWKSDAGGAGYSGQVPECRQGSLLALKPDFVIDGPGGLETEPGRIVAHACQDYGGYIVDSSGWSIYNFVTERSPDGEVQSEFQREFGFPMNTGVGANGWARDLDRIFTNLHVVDNWDFATWQIVSLSGGLLGAGLGTPRVPWAAPLGSGLRFELPEERPMVRPANLPSPELRYEPAGTSRLYLCDQCGTLVLRSKRDHHEAEECRLKRMRG